MRLPPPWLCCALLFAALAVSGRAQEIEDWEEMDASSQGGSLNLRFDSRGNADVNLGITTPEKGLLERVKGSLPCRIKPTAEGMEDSGFASFSGRCDALLRRKGTQVQGVLDFGPALQALGPPGETYLSVSVEVPASAFTRCPGWQRLGFGAGASCVTTIGIGKRQDTTLALAYGYRDADLLGRFAVLAAVLGLPVFLVLRRARKLRPAAADEEPATVWFGYWRAQQMILQLGWGLWLIVFYALRLDEALASWPSSWRWSSTC